MEDNEDSQLPRGWARSKIMEICNLINGRAFKTSEWSSKGLPIIRIQNLNNPDAEFNCCDFSVEEKYYVNDGQLLFAWSGTPETSFGAHIWRGRKAVLNQHIFKVEIDERFINKAFLMHLMNHNVTQYVRKAHGTAGLAHITKGKFEDSMMPIPPLNEQVRIVRRVEELLACLDAGVEGLRKVKAQLKFYRQAVLKYAFEGKLTEEWRKTHKDQTEPATELLEKITQERLMNLEKNKKLLPIGSFELPALPEGWIWTRVDWLCDVQTGPFGTQLHRNDYTSSGIPTIEIGDVHPTRDLREGTAHFIAKEKAIELKRFEVKHGDVLFSRVGTVGRCTIVPEGCDGWIMSTSLIRVRIVSKYLLPRHLLLYFWSPIAQGFAKRTSKGTTRAGTNSRIVGELPLIAPPIMEQQIVVEEIERRLTEVDNVEQTLNPNLTRASRLRQSILKIAFEGKLVPQDPNDEPAEKLLERIKAERAKSKGEKDTNRGRKNKPEQLELPNYVK